MLKKLLGLLAVIGTIFGAVAGAKKSKELKELENIVTAANQLFNRLSPEAKPYLITNFQRYLNIWKKDLRSVKAGEYTDADHKAAEEILSTRMGSYQGTTLPDGRKIKPRLEPWME